MKVVKLREHGVYFWVDKNEIVVVDRITNYCSTRRVLFFSLKDGLHGKLFTGRTFVKWEYIGEL